MIFLLYILFLRFRQGRKVLRLNCQRPIITQKINIMLHKNHALAHNYKKLAKNNYFAKKFA